MSNKIEAKEENYEQINSLLLNAKEKYINNLFQEEDLFLDGVTDYVCISHHTYTDIPFNTCKKVAKWIEKRVQVHIDSFIFVGAYTFDVKALRGGSSCLAVR